MPVVSPLERGLQVVALGVEARRPGRVVSSDQLGRRRLREVPVVVSVRRSHPVHLRGVDEPIGAVLAQRLEEPVARRRPRVVREDHGAGNEPVDDVEDLEFVDAVAARHRLGRVKPEPAGEHGEPSEDPLIGRVEQIVGPVDRRPEGLVRDSPARRPWPRTRTPASRRSRMSPGLIDRTRAAASSRASGMPSSRRQSSATASALSGPSSNPCRATAARSAKRATAGDVAASAASASTSAAERRAA